jgi:predicted ArsR family transcriptional regulator
MKQKVGWAEAIQKAFAQEAEVVPPEWKTLKQVAEELGMNRHHVCRKLAKLIKMGKAETRKFRTWSKGGSKRMGYLRSNPHYRIISKKG